MGESVPARRSHSFNVQSSLPVHWCQPSRTGRRASGRWGRGAEMCLSRRCSGSSGRRPRSRPPASGPATAGRTQARRVCSATRTDARSSSSPRRPDPPWWWWRWCGWQSVRRVCVCDRQRVVFSVLGQHFVVPIERESQRLRALVEGGRGRALQATRLGLDQVWLVSCACEPPQRYLHSSPRQKPASRPPCYAGGSGTWPWACAAAPSALLPPSGDTHLR
jgi:hypothetical protein